MNILKRNTDDYSTSISKETVIKPNYEDNQN